MDFIIIANSWSAGRDNPTSKHRIAIELVRLGHKVLWIEGSGMRTPSIGSSRDRLRMVRKVFAALRGVRRAEGEGQRAKSSERRTQDSGFCPLPSALSPEPFALSPWILAPLFIPLPRYELIRRLNGLICRWSMRFWGWRLGFRDPVLINYVPVLAEAMRGGRSVSQARDSKGSPRAPRVVYHCVDRWDAFAMYDSAMMGEMDRRCCRYADLVIASGGELYARCKAINPNTALIPHGVDWEHFRQAVEIRSQESESKIKNQKSEIATPLPPPALPPPIIGFFGLLSEWVDQELLLRLAREFPGAVIELIGKADVDVARMGGVPNIRLTGPRPFSELPSLVARFTVGIIPFVVNDLTRAVNPIKLREMLSAGCPVVSTALPEVELMRSLSLESATVNGEPASPPVQIAHDHDEFVAMVRRVIERPYSAGQRRAVSDSMAGETWTAKVEEILALIEGEKKDHRP